MVSVLNGEQAPRLSAFDSRAAFMRKWDSG